MLGRYNPDRNRTLYVPISDSIVDIGVWLQQEFNAKPVKKNAVFTLPLKSGTEMRVTVTPWRRGGDQVSQTTLGTVAFFDSPRIRKKALLRSQQLHQRIFDTRMLIGCVADRDLTMSDIRVIRAIAKATYALTFDGGSMLDWTGRLALNQAGEMDEPALVPYWTVVSSTELLSSSVINNARVETPVWEEFPFTDAFKRHIEYLSLKLPNAEVLSRAKLLKTFYKQANHHVALVATGRSAKLDRVAGAITKHKAAVSSDGWSFRDAAGKLILDRSGAFDPKASVPID